MEREHDKHRKTIVCPTKTCEDIEVSVPVEVHAHANVGEIELKCMGRHVVEERKKPHDVLKFKIVQKTFAKIPIDFVTEVEVREEHVDFDMHKCMKREEHKDHHEEEYDDE